MSSEVLHDEVFTHSAHFIRPLSLFTFLNERFVIYVCNIDIIFFDPKYQICNQEDSV